MKNETIEQETRKLFAEIKNELREGRKDLIHYISGTLNKRTRMSKIVERYREDAKIDYELDVITKEEYELEMDAVALLDLAVMAMNIY